MLLDHMIDRDAKMSSVDVVITVRGNSIPKGKVVMFYSSFKNTAAVLSPVISDDSRT